jgi:hydroxymethylbilane synthase
MPCLCNHLKVAARKSSLSCAQVEEVLQEMQKFYPSLLFDLHLIHTSGDIDKTTSLRTMEKTDFFTKQIDDYLLEKKCDVAIHSAKDLPSPLREGLDIVAMTKGVDPRDVLVFRDPIPKNGRIGTSSIRREEAIKRYRRDLSTVDIRGTIEERLDLLYAKKIDGLVMAEAALIRLKLTHLNKVFLECESAWGQGRLAIVARKENQEMKTLFLPIHYVSTSSI